MSFFVFHLNINLRSTSSTPTGKLVNMATRPFRIRPASIAAGDDKGLIEMFDSQLPWLATVGSGDQWGSTPFSDSGRHQTKYRTKVEQSEACTNQTSLHPDWVRAYVAEVEVATSELSPEIRELVGEDSEDGNVRVPVAAMVLEAKSADYVQEVLPEQDEEDPFVYMSYLLSDRRTASINKGAGAALIAHAKEEVMRLGVRRICLDCWRGNDRKLVR